MNYYVKQQYLPNKLKDRIYYTPSKNGREKGLVKKKDKWLTKEIYDK